MSVNPRHIAAILGLACGMMLAACSGQHGGPSNARMSQQIAAQFNKEFGDKLVKIQNMRESQGHITAKGHYIALVHFDMTFTKSLAEVKQQDGDSQAMELRVLYGRFNAGYTRSVTDEVLFEKTDKGWVLINSRQR